MVAADGLTRRQAIVAGAGAAGLAAGALATGASALELAQAAAAQPRREFSFDEGWLFHRGDITGAQAGGFNDDGWRRLDVPHDWSIEDLPGVAAADGGVTASSSDFAFITSPSPDGTPPQTIGPFDKAASAGQKQTGYTVGGIGWYRKHFTVPRVVPDERERKPDGDEQRVELRFDGIYQNADLWLNGHHLGSHAHGYVSFAFDVTRFLRPGVNVLAVRVDNSGANSRFYSGSGIYRHTWMTVTGPVRVPLWGVHVTTPVAGADRGLARVETDVANGLRGVIHAGVRVSVLDGRGRTVARRTSRVQRIEPGRGGRFRLDLPVARAALWSPDSPSLYRARCEVLIGSRVVDTVTQSFGFRTVAMDGNGFRLNGQTVKMRGGCCHHDNGPLGAVSLYRSEERRVQTLKALGFNAIRTSHNPPSPALLEACDRLGMLVYDEFTDMWQHQKNAQDYHLHFPAAWRRDLTNMILRDRNHPSVVIWSTGNEISVWDSAMGTDKTGTTTAAYARQLASLVRSLDRTRPVTEGGDALGTDRPKILDVGDIHYTTGSGSTGATLITPVAGAPVKLSDVHTAYPGKAVLCSESYPPAMYEAWQQVLENDWMVGDFTWTAWDYVGEAAIGAPPLSAGTANGTGSVYGVAGVGGVIPYPWYESYCGDVDLIGQRKPQSRYRSVVWGLSMIEMAVERPPPPGTQQAAIEAGALTWGFYDELESWTWNVTPAQPMTVHVYTPGDQVQLSLNGTVIATNSLSAGDQRYTTFTVPYVTGTLTAVAALNGKEIGRRTLETVDAPAKLRLTSDASRLTTARDDLAHVLVEVLDAEDRVVPDAVVPVSFTVSGAGTLAAVANANPHNVDSFRQPHRYTYHGQALAVLRPAKHAGAIRVTASSPGLQADSVSIPVAQLPVVRQASGSNRRRPPTALPVSSGAVLGGLMLAIRGRMQRQSDVGMKEGRRDG